MPRATKAVVTNAPGLTAAQRRDITRRLRHAEERMAHYREQYHIGFMRLASPVFGFMCRMAVQCYMR